MLTTFNEGIEGC